MFEATGWSYTNPIGKDLAFTMSPEGKKRFEVLKRYYPLQKVILFIYRFDFDHTLQLMTAIIRSIDSGELFVFTKGSPEAIGAVSNPAYLPKTYDREHKKHSRNGCYVLG